QEPAVGGLPPAHVPRPPPALLPQAVEAPVVPDPEAGVGLDLVAPKVAELGPSIEERRPPGDDRAHEGTPLGTRRGQRPLERREGIDGLVAEHRLRRARREMDITHSGFGAPIALGTGTPPPPTMRRLSG